MASGSDYQQQHFSDKTTGRTVKRMQCKWKIKPELYLCCFIKKGKRPEDLIYQPQFHFADMKWEFSDWMFLEYLSNPQRAAELFAQKWLLEKLPEISKKKICIGCIREEMEEMLKKTGTGPEASLPRSA